jgi:dephospho-CoA kinase
MQKIGLTGGIGSGKTIVATIFEKMGVPVYYADNEAKKMFLLQNVKNELSGLFGKSVLDTNGLIDRKFLGGIVFNDSSALEKLNNIIHPLVKFDFENWAREHDNYPYIIHEAAILFESGFYKCLDKVIDVDAPLELCISRVIKRDGVSRDHVLARMQHQWHPSKKALLADFLITNDGQKMVMPQVLEIHRHLLAKSK